MQHSVCVCVCGGGGGGGGGREYVGPLHLADWLVGTVCLRWFTDESSDEESTVIRGDKRTGRGKVFQSSKSNKTEGIDNPHHITYFLLVLNSSDDSDAII